MFVAGVVLLISGATPATPSGCGGWRSTAAGRVRGVALHGSIVGVALLVTAQGIARRLDGAWYLGAISLALGSAFSLLKGGDYEEALLLAALILALLGSRELFDRRAAFAPFSPGNQAAERPGASIWLGFFAYRHVEYGGELWWRFALNHDVSRFLRGSVVATVALLAFGVARLVRPAAAEVEAASEADLGDAARIIADSKRLPFPGSRSKSCSTSSAPAATARSGAHRGAKILAAGQRRRPHPLLLERANDFGARLNQARGERLDCM
jgi:phosphatidylglycerol lysyltransferase